MRVLQSIPFVGAAFREDDLRPGEVLAFWNHMREHFNSRVIRKRDAVEMQLVAQTLSLLGIVDRDKFLRAYTTTIGRRIYVPFQIGVPQSGWSLWSSLVVCVHEHQHIVQHDKQGLGFDFSYVTDRAARARFEAEAYRCNLEIHFWRTGQTPPVRPIAEQLVEYGCRPQDIETAAQMLALSAVSVRKGAVISEASHVAIEWLNEHVPRLRAGGGSP